MTPRASLWDQIVDFEALRQAARRAARGKRDRAAVARFLERLEPNLLALQRELVNGTYCPGEPQRFVIHDPKTRVISAAPFRDRVVHHALIGPLEPMFERRMVPHSFACRRGKGTHAALDHAQRLVRRHAWFHRFDVARCFDSIQHRRVLDCAARCVRNRRVLELLARILAAGGVEGRGLPIGSLTSQWGANLLLDRLDHFVLEQLRPGGYVRYMDDFVLFDDDRGRLRGLRGRLCQYLEHELGLHAKARSLHLAPCRDGLPFLGWRVYAGLRRVRPRNLRRIRRRFDRARTGGAETDEHPLRALEAVIEHLRAGNTRQLVRRMVRGRVAPPRTV